MSGRVRLHDLAGYRSGDKGDTVNIALFADDEAAYDVIVQEVTTERVREHFRLPDIPDEFFAVVSRYEAPNVLAVNFVLRGALGGGAPRSLRADNLGKTLGGALVRMEIDVPDELAGRRAQRPDVAWAEQILDGLPRSGELGRRR